MHKWRDADSSANVIYVDIPLHGCLSLLAPSLPFVCIAPPAGELTAKDRRSGEQRERKVM